MNEPTNVFIEYDFAMHMYVRTVNAIKHQADTLSNKSGLMRKARE